MVVDVAGFLTTEGDGKRDLRLLRFTFPGLLGELSPALGDCLPVGGDSLALDLFSESVS